MAGPILIDTHLHIYRTREEGHRSKAGGYVVWEYGEKSDVRYSRYGGNIDDALEAVDNAGFSKAVALGVSSPRPQPAAELAEGTTCGEEASAARSAVTAWLKDSNAWSCEVIRPHPKLVPYIRFDPELLPGEEGSAHIQEMAETHGARGVKMHPPIQRIQVGDRGMWPFYETCQELGLPIVSHSGPARGGEPYGEPGNFAAALEAFPRLTIVLAHMGGATWEQCVDIANAYPNAYFDICEIIAWTGGTNAPTIQQLAQLVKDIGPERVMMGSDFPWYDLDYTVEQIMDMPVLSNEEKEGMLGANAERILGL